MVSTAFYEIYFRIMCGRYTLIKLASFLKYFPWIEQPSLFPDAHYNIAPSQSIPVVTNENSPPKIDYLRWGLVPSWAKDGSITAGSKMINARAETLAEKPAFKRLLKSRRCLIPAHAFYEWKQTGKTKTPYCFRLKDERPFAFAGLFDRWKASDGTELKTCTIITTAANELLQEFHHRMPVILRNEDCQRWIQSGELSGEEITMMFTPYRSDRMIRHPVSNMVNSVKNDGPELMKAIEEPKEKPPFQPSLFPT
jgi:putative SOS response-associated peptidase YedK